MPILIEEPFGLQTLSLVVLLSICPAFLCSSGSAKCIFLQTILHINWIIHQILKLDSTNFLMDRLARVSTSLHPFLRAAFGMEGTRHSCKLTSSRSLFMKSHCVALCCPRHLCSHSPHRHWDLYGGVECSLWVLVFRNCCLVTNKGPNHPLYWPRWAADWPCTTMQGL